MELNKKSAKSYEYIKVISYALIALNILSILLGVIYISFRKHSSLWNIFGVGLIATFLGNIILVNLNVVRDRWVGVAKQIRQCGYAYLVFSVLSMLGMAGGGFVISGSYESSFRDVPFMYFIVYFSYYGNLVLGGLNAYVNIKCFNRNAIIERKNGEGWIRAIANLSINLILFSFMAAGVFFSYVLLTRKYINNTEIIVPAFSMFYGYVFLSAGGLLLTRIPIRRRRVFQGVQTLNFVVFIVFMFPILMSGVYIKTSEKTFAETFGRDWEKRIDSNVEAYFLRAPFSIPAYFFGIPSDSRVRVRRDVLYYAGGNSKDDGIKLHFDAYLPPVNSKNLPGNNSTLIRIHGGAWVTGDKGWQNILQENKYFAEQGYVVFDIQYGLSKDSKFTIDFVEPDYVKGNFTIDDMMMHIGVFTNYLYDHHSEYEANLDSVFISGGSAGGHLACAAALAISSGNYIDVFNPNLKVKGIIPFYPANGLASKGKITGSREFMNPDLLVEVGSPPALIYQGTHDGLVAPEVSKKFKKAYENKNNPNCAILWMPLAGHSSDINFSGHYNQMFLYYMERFMYLYQ
jgi:acetyl esterase/lipase